MSIVQRFKKLPATRYESHDAAASIAIQCQHDDMDWTYTVQPSGMWFVVMVTDEDGHELGPL